MLSRTREEYQLLIWKKRLTLLEPFFFHSYIVYRQGERERELVREGHSVLCDASPTIKVRLCESAAAASYLNWKTREVERKNIIGTNRVLLGHFQMTSRIRSFMLPAGTIYTFYGWVSRERNTCSCCCCAKKKTIGRKTAAAES